MPSFLVTLFLFSCSSFDNWSLHHHTNTLIHPCPQFLMNTHVHQVHFKVLRLRDGWPPPRGDTKRDWGIMRAMKEHEREMDMIFPFSPVAWNLLFFCLFFFLLRENVKVLYDFRFQTPSFRHPVHLPTVTPDMSAAFGRRQMADKSLCGCLNDAKQSTFYKMCEGWNENSCNCSCRMLCSCWRDSLWAEGGQGVTAVLVGICRTVLLTDKAPKCQVRW